MHALSTVSTSTPQHWSGVFNLLKFYSVVVSDLIETQGRGQGKDLKIGPRGQQHCLKFDHTPEKERNH